jgi:hypothetical protein
MQSAKNVPMALICILRQHSADLCPDPRGFMVFVQILGVSWIVVELVKRNPHLTREREQRRAQ